MNCCLCFFGDGSSGNWMILIWFFSEKQIWQPCCIRERCANIFLSCDRFEALVSDQRLSFADALLFQTFLFYLFDLFVGSWFCPDVFWIAFQLNHGCVQIMHVPRVAVVGRSLSAFLFVSKFRLLLFLYQRFFLDCSKRWVFDSWSEMSWFMYLDSEVGGFGTKLVFLW